MNEEKMTDKSLYRTYLEKNGIATTRSGPLDEAIKKLHRAFCELDDQQLSIMQLMLNSPLSSVINNYGNIEELRKDFA